jgi:hypothetical protein
MEKKGSVAMANRTVCSVLEEMRTCFNNHNYSYLPSLIEEVQSLVNRMEAALWDQKDFEYKADEYKEIKKEIKKLKETKKELTNE